MIILKEIFSSKSMKNSCKDCITYMICKNIVEEKKHDIYGYAFSYNELKRKCSIIKDEFSYTPLSLSMKLEKFIKERFD